MRKQRSQVEKDKMNTKYYKSTNLADDESRPAPTGGWGAHYTVSRKIVQYRFLKLCQYKHAGSYCIYWWL